MDLCSAKGLQATDEGENFWQILRKGVSGFTVDGGYRGENFWRLVCDAGRGSNSHATLIVKATSLPSDAGSLTERIRKALGEGSSVSCNMVNGVVYGYLWEDVLPVDELEAWVSKIRKAAAELNGHCVVEACPRELKERIDVWGLEGPQLDLMKRIKEQFDPNGTLNPGRFVKGI